ncbi:hypothetical protein PP182_12180 [Maribacter sp. PR1]|uniref:DUF304 domain-containing protein n=1 Tax=Maribacter cobaltidurans TaxID=1178778 RepID=A0ABU7IV55_9FLAO|nr:MULTISPECIES: hypothetical protein [Maribacter]MDC6389445.1 hypothetical protein [Maribacter sp. PR1]MEE1976834.1 hypothetical protein [Maribacter cobaltidurans]
MKIKFKKKRLYIHLVLGLIWIGLAILRIWEEGNAGWMDYGFLLVGTLYLGHFLYDSYHQYIVIKNEIVRKNMLYGFETKMVLDEITSVQNTSGYYILKTKTKTKSLKIDLALVEVESLIRLKSFLENLKLQQDHGNC